MEAIPENIKVPELRFSEFSGEMKSYTIAEMLISSHLGGNYKNTSEPVGLPLIKMGNLRRGYVDVSSLDYIVDETEICEDDQCRKGDLLFNTRNTLELVGKVAIWKNELPVAYFNSNILKLEFPCNAFMNAWFNSSFGRRKMKAIATGTTSVAAIYTRHLQMIPVRCPILPEQQKIAEFLTVVDERIAKLKRKKELLEEYKKGMMQKLFSKEIRFKDEDGNDFPDWEGNRLGEVSQIVKGKQLNRSDMDGDGHIPVMNGGITPSGFTLKHNAAANSITISEGGNSCGYVAFQTVDFWLGGHCYALEKESLITKFLFQCLKYNQRLIMSLRVGSGLPNIQKKHLSQFSISHPSSGQEQLKIAEFLTGIDDKITAVANQIDKAAEFKRGLLQKMFV